ncbi:MAG: apolipoprotein A1/A4/E family protein, partial [Clostridia bacterium]|nr:apolipoprotein A1/A4/E family protein [Clostridia bacterium]
FHPHPATRHPERSRGLRDVHKRQGQQINLADYLDGFDPDIMEIIDGGIKTDANNNYVATIKLTDLTNCEWKGITSQTITVNWAIEKAHLTAGWDSSEHVADGQVFQPVVDKFLAGLADVDKPAVDFANDFIYSGDLNMSAVGAYTITASLNASAAWTKNYILDGNADWAYVIVPREGMDVITIEWDQTQFTFNGSVQKPNYTVFDKYGNDITSQVASVITLGGDVNISKWAGDYKAIITVAETSNYFIRSGATCNYSIVTDPVTGEGTDPGTPNPNPGNEGEGGSNFIDKLLASHFPLWQVAAMAVAGLLAIIFTIKAAQYGSRAKKANGEAKKLNAKTYASLLPIFSTETVALGLSNKIWTIMAFAFAGFALLMLAVMMINRSRWKKAELAKEAAVEGNEERKREAEKQERMAFQERMVQAGGASGGADNSALIDSLRREMEERHRQEMDAMKMMFANMMGRGAGEDGFTYASLDDTEMLVQRVIAGLLPAVQQMMPEPTAYLAAPQEQNEELIALVEEQKAIMEEQSEEIRNMAEAHSEEMQAMSAKMDELQQQLAAMSLDRVDGVLIADGSDEKMAEMADTMRDQLTKIEELQAQLAAMEQERVDGVLMPDQSDDMKAMAEAMQAQLAKIDELQAQLAASSQENGDTIIIPDQSEEIKALTEQIAAMSKQLAERPQTITHTVYVERETDEEDNDDEEEWDSILDEDDDFVEATFIDADGTVRKSTPNFRMRLKESSDKNREWYAAIKNLFCSQKGVTYRVYKRVEKIRYQGQVIAVIGIAKRSMKLWLALNPHEYDARRYHHKDVSDKPRFVEVPLYVRVGSDRALTRAEELILALFQEQAMEARKRYNDRDIQELIFTLKHNRLLANKESKQLLCESIHVHDCDVLDNETAEKCIESKNVDFIDDSVIETVKLDDIDANFQDGNRVTLDKLRKAGLVSEECTGYTVVAGQRL